jgi:hypothetical protein
VGLAEIWSMGGAKPVNLVAPRRQAAPVSVTRQRGIFYGAAAAVFFFTMIGMMWYVLAQKKAEIQALNKRKADLEETMKMFAQERADLEVYKDWEQTSILWLDELYDLSARYPWHKDFRINQLVASTTGTKKGSKEPYVGKINLAGYAPIGQEGFIKDLGLAMTNDTHVRPVYKTSRIVQEKIQFEMRIDIARQDAKKFQTRLIVPPEVIEKVKAAPAAGKKKGFAPPPVVEPDPDADPDLNDGGNP